MERQPSQFDIHPGSGLPIYQQIVDQTYALVAGGRLKPGDLLPSVRQVARSAEVNPMTVSKAYSLLETEGLVERVRGQGMRILQHAESNVSLDERKEQVREILAPPAHRAQIRAQQLGLTEGQFRQILYSLSKESPKESPKETPS